MANQVTTTFSINANQALQQLAQYQQQLRNTIQLQTQLGSGATNPGAGGAGGAGGGGGLFGGLGGVLAGAVSAAAVVQGVRTVVAATKESEAANRALGASAIEAGKSYEELSKASRSFADAALISSAQAARSTAQLQRLISLAGEGDQLEKYQKGFLDLAAARGVAFEELDTLFQGIIAGTDDALNRFGKQDPSKLAEQYAKSIGKTVEQLTEQEKVLSRLKAFDTDFGLFSGANEDRVNSFSGSIDRMNKSLADTVANLGKWASQNRIIRDNIALLNMLTGDMAAGTADDDRVTALIRQGMTDEQIVRSLGGGQVSLYDRLVALGALAPFSRVGSAITSGDWRQLSYSQTPSAADIRSQSDAGIYSAIAARRRALERTDVATEDQAQALRQREVSEAFDAWQEQRRQADKEAAEQRRKAAEEQARQYEDAKRRVLELRSVIAGAADDRNPFVTIFENAAKAVERVRELAKGLGGDLERRALEAVRSQNFAALTEARYGAALQSFNLRSSAADFRSGINLEALTPMQENKRRLSQLRGQLESIGAFQQGPLRPALDAEASESQRRQAETRYQEDLRRFEAERAVRDRQIVELTQGFNPARLDAQTRELAAGAREREAVRVGRQEEEARKLFAELSSALKNGVPVTLASGEQVVRIVNEAPDSATVTTRPSPAATSGRYSN